MRVLIVWSGALVPAYRRFFAELARLARVRALGPRRWTHGSVAQAGEAPAVPVAGCDLVPTAFWPPGSSRYLVPSLPLHLWAFRPKWVYFMEEPDRPALLWHALLVRLLWPPARVACYALQNLPRPAYYRWHHALALALNRRLVDRVIAASSEAAEVARGHGFRGPLPTVPLWGSEDLFTAEAPPASHASHAPAVPAGSAPSLPAERAAARRALGIPEEATVLLFAGSLVEAKGLRLLAGVLARFPALRLAAAGRGPLEAALREALGARFHPAGPLQGEDLARFYRLGDYVILPSLTTGSWKEQVGRALIEGILCGRIALGSDSGHIPELTLFPETTFRQGDAADLARLLAGLPLRDAERVRSAQRRNVEARFTAAAAARATWKALSGDSPEVRPLPVTQGGKAAPPRAAGRAG